MLNAGVVHSWRWGLAGGLTGWGPSTPRSEQHHVAGSNCRIEHVGANWHFLLFLAFSGVQMVGFDN